MDIVWFMVVGAILLLAIAYVIARVFAKGLTDGFVVWWDEHAEIVGKKEK